MSKKPAKRKSGPVEAGIRALKPRMEAASLYRPRRVRLLLVAEAPPCDANRYFYFDGLDRHDWLYLGVCRALFPDAQLPELRHKKASFLKRLKDMGVFLIDVIPSGFKSPTKADLLPHVLELVSRCQALKPEAIVIIKSQVYEAAYEPLRAAGLPVLDVKLPFPGQGWQNKFHADFVEVSRTVLG